MIDIQIDINDNNLHDMSGPVPARLLQRLPNAVRTPLTCAEFLKKMTQIMGDQAPPDVILCEQQLQNTNNDTYQTGHRKKRKHDGSQKLLEMEVEFLSFLLVQLHEKYEISQGNNTDLKFQVIYLGASSGVTESTKAILHHVEKLQDMFPPRLIDWWYFVDPRSMKLSDKNPNHTHLQCLFGDKEMQDFGQRQKDDPKIRYIVISDIRTPINYDMVSAPRELFKDVLGAYFLCESLEKKQSLFELLKVVMEDALQKSMFVEEVIERDQKYQENVRNTLNLDAMSTKFRAPYFYPHATKPLYSMMDIPRGVQPEASDNSTELREFFMFHEQVKVVAPWRRPNQENSVDTESVFVNTLQESQSENLEWNATATTRNGTYESVDVQKFDNKMAAYNHDKQANGEKLHNYIKTLYKICYNKCMGASPTDAQLQYLNAPNDGKSPHTPSRFEEATDQLFWAWINDTTPDKSSFFDSPSCKFIKDKGFINPVGAEESLQASVSLQVSGLLANPDAYEMDRLMLQYETGVKTRQRNEKNYSNFGCNSTCPLFIERLDILMHLRVLLLIKHDPGIVTGWLEKHMITENAEKYTPLIQRLLSVYDTNNNDNNGIKDRFSFAVEAKQFKVAATEALRRCKTANDLQYMLGYIKPYGTLPLAPDFFHTRHWAIVFYNSCVQKIAKTTLDFEYPYSDTNRPQNDRTLTDLRTFFRPYLHDGADANACKYLGTNPAWNTASWPSGFPILHFAAQFGCTALVYLILTEYLPETLRPKLINFQRKKTGCTALHLAVYHKKTDIEQLLIEHGALSDIRCTEKGENGKKGIDETVDQLRRDRSRESTHLPRIEKPKEQPPNPDHEEEPWETVEKRGVKKREKDPKARGLVKGGGKRKDLSDLMEQLIAVYK